ncbi:MAG: response regulator [Proteobacteria bacterium]|nr:response regulator [Pseudomonadota bacterium]
MKNLIIADDSFTVRKVIEMLLKPLGYNLIFTENGEKTLNAVKSSSADALILDFGLPDRDSGELSKEIKKQKPNLPILIMYNGKDYTGDKILSLSQCDEIIEKPFDSQTFITKIEGLKAKTGVITEKKEEQIKPAEKEFLKDIISSKEEPLESFELDFGEEFTIKEEEKASLEELDLSIVEPEEVEELEELKDIEEIEVEELKIEEEKSPSKEEIGETVTLEDLLGEEIVIEEEVEKPQKKEKVEIEQVPEEKKTEEPSIDINEFFSDLNEILVEKEKPSAEKIFEEKKVKPVVEEVAKELKEMEEIVASEEELDIWDFELPTEKEGKEPVEQVVETKREESKSELLSLERKELEKIIKEITYEIIEKVAWEVVPEIVDTILKDKFPKR